MPRGMGDGGRDPETPRDRKVYKGFVMTDEGMRTVYLNADGAVAVVNSAGGLRWMKPATVDQVVESTLPRAI